MKLTPKTLTDRISQLISDGHKKQVAAKIVYGEMRAEWKSKHPGVKLPSWLLVETRMKNPVRKKKKSVKRKNPVTPLRKNKNDWNVDRFKDGKWEPVASFKFNKRKEALAYANAYANAHKVKMKIYK